MALSMASIPKERMGNATGIFNLMRNIGVQQFRSAMIGGIFSVCRSCAESVTGH